MKVQRRDRIDAIKFVRIGMAVAAVGVLVAGTAVGTGVLAHLNWTEGPGDVQQLVVSPGSGSTDEGDPGTAILARLTVQLDGWNASYPDLALIPADHFEVDEATGTILVDGAPRHDWTAALIVQGQQNASTLIVWDERPNMGLSLNGPNNASIQHSIMLTRTDGQLLSMTRNCEVVVEHTGSSGPRTGPISSIIHVGPGQVLTVQYVGEGSDHECPRGTIVLEVLGIWDRPH